jgi:hypothetical protein
MAFSEHCTRPAVSEAGMKRKDAILTQDRTTPLQEMSILAQVFPLAIAF